jgi:hypothetical protein
MLAAYLNEGGSQVDLTPGEKAVLAQTRVLYYNAAKREQQVKALQGLWPPTHYETYRAAFAGLVAKQLISHNGSQLFRITDAGLKAMGVTVAQPATREVAQRLGGQQANSPLAATTRLPKPVTGIRSALLRLGFLRPRV